jgi:hypothetical protein
LAWAAEPAGRRTAVDAGLGVIFHAIIARGSPADARIAYTIETILPCGAAGAGEARSARTTAVGVGLSEVRIEAVVDAVARYTQHAIARQATGTNYRLVGFKTLDTCTLVASTHSGDWARSANERRIEWNPVVAGVHGALIAIVVNVALVCHRDHLASRCALQAHAIAANL